MNSASMNCPVILLAATLALAPAASTRAEVGLVELGAAKAADLLTNPPANQGKAYPPAPAERRRAVACYRDATLLNLDYLVGDWGNYAGAPDSVTYMHMASTVAPTDLLMRLLDMRLRVAAIPGVCNDD